MDLVAVRKGDRILGGLSGAKVPHCADELGGLKQVITPVRFRDPRYAEQHRQDQDSAIELTCVHMNPFGASRRSMHKRSQGFVDLEG
jgi:hypothetical protein